MIVKLLIEHHLEFLSLNGGSRGSSESTLVKMSNCWKSHALAHIENADLDIGVSGVYLHLLKYFATHIYVLAQLLHVAYQSF